MIALESRLVRMDLIPSALPRTSRGPAAAAEESLTPFSAAAAS